MVVLIIFPVILQTVINVIMLSIGRQGADQTDNSSLARYCYTTKPHNTQTYCVLNDCLLINTVIYECDFDQSMSQQWLTAPGYNMMMTMMITFANKKPEICIRPAKPPWTLRLPSLKPINSAKCKLYTKLGKHFQTMLSWNAHLKKMTRSIHCLLNHWKGNFILNHCTSCPTDPSLGQKVIDKNLMGPFAMHRPCQTCNDR